MDSMESSMIDRFRTERVKSETGRRKKSTNAQLTFEDLRH